MSDSTELQSALADRFRIERDLGRGGMATVYLAYDLRQDRQVALKMIRPEVAAALGADRFLREIKVTAKLRHPHILPLFDSGVANGQLWYTMPYIQGGTLRQRLIRDTRLPLEDACRISRDVLAALAEAHGQGIIHRDIKPENILLEGGEAVVADFGIAQAVTAAGTERMTAMGLALGTPGYMSPEQAVGEPTDQRSDVYSVGCVLYEMLTGAPPRPADTTQSRTVAALPGSVRATLEKALAPNPSGRFTTAAEFAAALGSAEEARTPPHSRRRIALVAVAVLTLLGLTFYAGRRIPTEAAASGSVASGLNQKLRQLTFTEGIEEWPAWSPDGTRLAYVAEVGGIRQLFLRTMANGAERRLTDERRDDIQPAWSPDGHRIAFVRANTAGGKLEPNDINGWYQEGGDIWSLDLSTGRETRLVEDASSPTYSPTGAGDDIHPSVAADGGRVAFAVRGLNSDLWRLPVSPATGLPSGEPVPWVKTTRVESRGAWSRDGRTIAFNSDRLGEMNIWVRGVADSVERQLTRGPGGDYQPTWSLDGKRLVFFSARSGNADIWSVETGDGRLTRLTDDPATDTNPFYSPDGRLIAFLSDRGGRSELWVMNADGSQPRRVAGVVAGGHFLRWTDDSRAIVFRAESGARVQIYRASVEDGTLTPLPAVASGAHMSFSPDRTRVLDVRGHKTLWVYPLDGSAPREIFSFADPDVRIDYPSWSPDGRWILFDRAAPRGGDLWMIEGSK